MLKFIVKRFFANISEVLLSDERSCFIMIQQENINNVILKQNLTKLFLH